MDGSEDDAVYSDEIEDNNDSTRLTDDEGNDVYDDCMTCGVMLL